MFSDFIKGIENNNRIIDSTATNIEGILMKVKNEENLTLDDLSVLINIDPQADSHFLESILAVSQKIKARLFNGQIYTIVPLYVSSICQEHCTYCNYRAGNKDKEIQRLRLSNDELIAEVKFLAKKGLRVIELVYATDPFVSVSDLSDHIRITHDVLSDYGGGLVGLNARPYSVDDYDKLKQAGLDFVVLWQETYNRSRYKEVHLGNTEKTHFNYRVNAPERMLLGGINNIGLGVLSGLNNWREDWFMLMSHVDYLLKNYEINTVILGIPRLKPAAGAILKETAFIPDDKEYLLAISLFNLFFPTALPFVNTRESWDTCLKIAKGGGTLFTFNCKTIPGGYSLGRSGYQFPTYDFTVDRYIGELNGFGLKPVFSWNFPEIIPNKNLMKAL